MKTKIHVWDLPAEKVYVKLKDNFRDKIFRGAYKAFGSWGKAGDFLSIKRGDTTIPCDWKNRGLFIPLTTLFKICKKLNIPKNELERNINKIKFRKAGKTVRGGTPIDNPKLPVKINEDFIEILGHLCGDGTLTRRKGRESRRFGYINSEPTLIRTFQKKMKRVFGGIEPKIYVRRDKPNYRRPNYYLSYPAIVSLFILSVFNYKPHDDMKLPGFVFNLPKKMKCKFLRALFDDEGTVRTKNKKIAIGLKPEKPLNGIKRLLFQTGVEPNGPYNIRGMWRLEISSKENIMRFKKLIGFKHPQKAKKLSQIIKIGWKFERYKNGTTKRKIASYLKIKKEATTQEISDHLNGHYKTTEEHLFKLKKNGTALNTETNNRLWRLREGP